jgi:hypothetical protein
MPTGLFYLFSLSLELLSRNSLDLMCGAQMEWVCRWTHTLCIFTHDHAGQLRRRCGDWTRSIAWHNRHGTAHGTPSLLQCKVARREGSRSGPIWRQSEAACSVRLLCTAGSHNGTWPGRWLRCWGRHWDERQRETNWNTCGFRSVPVVRSCVSKPWGTGYAAASGVWQRAW